ncbi:MAG: hypothetical protein LBF67_03270 [Prevotellaceae bacterium]|jgi:hypothetical protein|nr:hypothetical protein [Prevotellaceae bacterium]
MNKQHFYRNTVASTAATVVLALALSIGFSACSKDENNGEELYQPSPTMTNAEILKLFEEVDVNMASVRKVAIEDVEKETVNGKTEQERDVQQYDLDAKKGLKVLYDTDGTTIDVFIYTEDSVQYEYLSSNYNDGKGATKNSYKVGSIIWKRLEGDVFEEEPQSGWKVEGNSFVWVDAKDTKKTKTVTITSTKRVAAIKKEGTTDDGTYVAERKYDYSPANPALPSGFEKSNFSLTTEKQYSLKVVWAEGLGESTIYTYPGSKSIYFEKIKDYAPKDPKGQGNNPVLYNDSNFTSLVIGSYLELTDNTQVIYVKW